MRVIVATLIVALSFDAIAQAPSPTPTQASVAPLPPAPIEALPPPPPLPLGITPAPDVVDRWQRARIVSLVGTMLGVIGTGFSLASVLYIAATHYPPSASDLTNPPSPSDPGPTLAYVGSSASAAGFVLSASALGYEHHLLDRLGVDPGRGTFGVGTAIGVVGFVGTGASYFFGLTDFFGPRDRSIAVLATSIGGAALCGLAGILYTFDSSRNMRVWKGLGSYARR
ncbi:MAG TPA: hypothetical protein VN947_35215 [Polyangia bacterium]|nr:hypothetical protein [Polyangia bacterium]